MNKDTLITAELLHDLYIEKGLSTVQIARQLGLFMGKALDRKGNPAPDAPKVQRELLRYNIPVRSKSQAQKHALDKGAAIHPTKGRERTVAEKTKIGVASAKHYAKLSKEERKNKMTGLNNFWKKATEKQKQYARTKAAQGILRAKEGGSKLEKAVCNMLVSFGYNIQRHVKNLFRHEKLECDILLTNPTIVIEIDGPRHYCRFMDKTVDRLVGTIKADTKKNNLVVSHDNVWMIRVIFPFEVSVIRSGMTLKVIRDTIEKIKTEPTGLPPNERLIIIDAGKLVYNKSSYDHPDYIEAIKIINGN